MLHQRPFAQVDVFTAEAYRGNPLAVVLEASGLSVDDMQRFARWTNLSETTFVLPPSPEAAALGADYRVRIFTPTEELPFGHLNLGNFTFHQRMSPLLHCQITTALWRTRSLSFALLRNHSLLLHLLIHRSKVSLAQRLQLSAKPRQQPQRRQLRRLRQRTY
jgi:hypothetical protein